MITDSRRLPLGSTLPRLPFGQSSESDKRIITRREVSAAAGTRVGLKKTKRALGQSGTLVREPGWIEDEEEQVAEKSKNQLKREASLALELAYDLADLSTKNLKQVARVSGMPEEMLEAISLAKSLSIDAKNGRKRQYAFVAKLFREQNLDIEEVHEIIQATKDGTIHAGALGTNEEASVSSQDDLTEDESASGARAASWTSGLLSNDPNIADEVYSLSHIVDGQHLRQLVRNAQKELAAGENEAPADSNSVVVDGLSPVHPKPRTRAQSALKRYLRDVAVRIGDDD